MAREIVCAPRLSALRSPQNRQHTINGEADGPVAIDLATLAPNRGFIVQGDVVNDIAGYSIASAGDMNNDGFADIIVGAPLGNDSGSNAGEPYVIFGSADFDLGVI